MMNERETPWKPSPEEEAEINRAVAGAREVLRSSSAQARTEALFQMVRLAYDGSKFEHCLPRERDSLGLLLNAATEHYDHYVLHVPGSAPAHHAFTRQPRNPSAGSHDSTEG